MRPGAAIRGAVDNGLIDERVDSRWWYWIAAIPLTFTLWTITVVWVIVAVALGPLTISNPILRPGEISMVAFGVPSLVLTVVFPFAMYADASAILDAELVWQPKRVRLTACAAAGPFVAVGGLLYGIVTESGPSVPLWGIVLGFLVTVPVASFYLYRRHDRIGVS